MSDMIKVENLTEVYPDGTKAVDGISFTVKEGEFFGFLGPNGAGKTTTIKILTTLLEKTSGLAAVAGIEVNQNPKAIRRIIGVQSQYTIVDDDLTGRENLLLQGHLQRIYGNVLEQRVNELLGLMGLADVADKKVSQYSGGMKRRLDLASALVHKPKLLFLDEPTIGLDPQARAAIWQYLQELNKKEGVTVFLTTQYLDEADKLCQRIAIIDQGRIVLDDSPLELKRQLAGDTITIKLNTENSDSISKEKSRIIVAAVKGVSKVFDIDEGLAAVAINAEQIVPDIVRAFDRNRILLASVSFSSPSLDDVFLQYTGRRLRPEDLEKKPNYAFAKMPKKRKMPFH
jgi:ABC-2 type transport system ATP-binding protein